MSIVDEARRLAAYYTATGSTDTAATLRELADIVARLPVTADGVPVVPMCDLWEPMDDGQVRRVQHVIMRTFPDVADWVDCYSTREAAVAAARLANGPHDHDHPEDA